MSPAATPRAPGRDRRAGGGRPSPGAPGLATRLAAIEVVDGVLRGRSFTESLLENESGALARLEPRDRALARAIVGATLRRLGSLRALLGERLARGLPRKAGALEAILLTGAAQFLLLQVPPHAAVGLAVDAARRDGATAGFAGLVNAVLRGLAGDMAALRARLEAASEGDLAPWLAARWRAAYGEAATAGIAAAVRHVAPLDITAREDAAGWAERLGGRLLPTGSIRLKPEGAVTELAGFAEGAWWVQDAASALPARLLGEVAGRRVADLCAAPGGKTAQLAAAGAHVTAVDISGPRLGRLAENLARLSLADRVEVIAADLRGLEAEPFDAILLDAPCSATGTLRRHPDVQWLKDEADVARAAALQAELIDAAVRLLRPGGILVYATCSLEPEEGERQVAAALARHPGLARVPVAAAELGGLAELVNAAGELRCLPVHLPAQSPEDSGIDGFFAARLRRG